MTCSGVLATILLVATNAFFVAAEFSLISARRDRLEALGRAGQIKRGHRRFGRANSCR